jgi:hypothetical protein
MFWHRVGGNSAKATSGINGCKSKFQLENSIQDELSTFKKDTIEYVVKSLSREHGQGCAKASLAETAASWYSAVD